MEEELTIEQARALMVRLKDDEECENFMGMSSITREEKQAHNLALRNQLRAYIDYHQVQ